MSFGDLPPHASVAPSQRLRSPEQVELELPIAGPTSRMLAFAIDLVLMTVGQFIVFGGLLYATFTVFDVGEGILEWLGIAGGGSVSLEGEADGASLDGLMMVGQAIFYLVQFVIQWGYFVTCELLMSGRSPGKAMLGLRVVRDAGLPIRFRESALRNLLRAVDMLPTAYLVGLITMTISRDTKRLGDFAAGTLVVREDRPTAAPPLGYETQAGDSIFRFDRDQLAAIGVAERRLIRQTLRRIDGLSPERSSEALERATDVLCERMEYTEEVGPRSRRAFLLALLRASEET